VCTVVLACHFKKVIAALEAETAISHLHLSKQDHIRHLVANNLKRLIKSDVNNENKNKNTKMSGIY
jgi:hypothetical protein